MTVFHSTISAFHFSSICNRKTNSNPVSNSSSSRRVLLFRSLGMKSNFLCNDSHRLFFSETNNFGIPVFYRKRNMHRNKRFHFVVSAKMKTKDHYATLNLDRNATLGEIKSSYRNLARKVRA